MPETKSVLYSSKIIKAGAIIADSKTLLAHWDESKSIAENLKLAQCNNLLGKASRSRVRDILGIFRGRYLAEASVLRSLVTLVKGQFSAQGLNCIFYFHAAQSDSLLHDLVTDWLFPKYQLGQLDINIDEVKVWLSRHSSQGKTSGQWSEATVTRVARGLLSTLRDFGILQGAVKKRLAPIYLPVEAFAYIALYLQQHLTPSGEKLLHSKEWELFFLAPEVRERLFLDAHQHHLLDYQAAGSIIRIRFPNHSLEEYAHVIAQRSH